MKTLEEYLPGLPPPPDFHKASNDEMQAWLQECERCYFDGFSRTFEELAGFALVRDEKGDVCSVKIEHDFGPSPISEVMKYAVRKTLNFE
jgi:hypothetical protein